MQERYFVSEFNDKQTKIKRKTSLYDFRLILILELASAFVLVLLKEAPRGVAYPFTYFQTKVTWS